METLVSSQIFLNSSNYEYYSFELILHLCTDHVSTVAYVGKDRNFQLILTSAKQQYIQELMKRME
jgi:hypothetical protein